MMTSTQTTKSSSNYLRALAVLAILASFLVMVSAKPAHAFTTFTVTTIGDQVDGNLGNGICDVELKATQCTLRAAIQEANFEPGADVIKFNVGGGTGVKTITPASQLPEITEQVTIDGYSQPGASPNTLTAGDNAAIKIELNGRDAFSDGLVIKASNVGVSGLAINRFASTGVSIEGGLGARIEGNFIGTDPTGTQDLGNRSAGVDINGTSGSGANIIGGAEPAQRNLISGNDSEGVFVFSGSAANALLGNYIGTKKDGTTALGNGTHGVDLGSGSGNTVGGSARASANTIAFNGQQGVQVGFSGVNSTGNSILRNSIFSNGGSGIDLRADGPTANDPGDADAGPNGLQNKPVLTSARNGSGKTTVKGSLNSTPNQTYKLQFFSNPPGTDEGKKLIDSTNFSTDAGGNASFTFNTPKSVPVGRSVTATATDPSGNTSEFSAPRTVKDGVAPAVKTVSPADTATGVAPGTNVSAIFSEAMKASTINETTVKLRKVGTSTSVATVISYDAARKKAVLNPKTNLQPGASYFATVTTGSKDLAGNALDQNKSLAGNQTMVWKFTVKK